MRRLHTAITIGILLAAAQAHAQTNFDFEAGDLSGWTPSGGNAVVATSHEGMTAPDGQHFLLVPGGCSATSVSQTISLTAGAQIQGWGAFLAHDYLPYNDWASAAVEVYGGGSQLVFYADVAQVGDFGAQPWTPFQFTAPATGSYTVVFSSGNALDCAATSFGLFDLQWAACADGDADGVCDADDNCPLVPNNQSDNDGDGTGDACDADNDDDGVADGADTCPYHPNPDQSDVDQDGAGDACDTDDDGDGITDADDACVTAASRVVDASGCSVPDLCPCESAWKNHGAHVVCVTQRARDFVTAGLLAEQARAALVSAAAQSGCGSK